MEFYSDNVSSIDMREEFHDVLYGNAVQPGQGRQFILRRLSDTTCVCWDAGTGGSKSPDCKYCSGEGYQFSETWEFMVMFRGVAPVYKPGFLATGDFPQNDYGYTDPNRATAYCEYMDQATGRVIFPNYERYTLQTARNHDKLYEVKVDGNGNTMHPVVKTAKWKVINIVPLHGDFGRVEFWELALSKEDIS